MLLKQAKVLPLLGALYLVWSAVSGHGGENPYAIRGRLRSTLREVATLQIKINAPNVPFEEHYDQNPDMTLLSYALKAFHWSKFL